MRDWKFVSTKPEKPGYYWCSYCGFYKDTPDKRYFDGKNWLDTLGELAEFGTNPTDEWAEIES